MMNNFSSGTISRIESNITNPNKETLLKISDSLELDSYQKADILGIEFNNINRHLPDDILKENLFRDINLHKILSVNFNNYALLNGKDYFINECDSSLEQEDKEILYVHSINDWRKTYPEDFANTYHVPKRIKRGKFAKFLLNSCEESKNFMDMDKKYYRQSKLLNRSKEFRYNLMITKTKLTIFLGETSKALTIKDSDIINNARKQYLDIWNQL